MHFIEFDIQQEKMDEAFNTDKIISEAVLTKLERTGAHSHIRGLGLDDMLQPKEVCLLVCIFCIE